MSKVAINQAAPDFRLKDYLGQTIQLSDYRGQKNVILIFNRGFTWPFCQAHMAQLRRDYDHFQIRDTELLVIGPENARSFQAYFTKNNLPFTGLPDPSNIVLKLYGQEVNLFKLGRMPAQVIVDKGGTARYVHYGHSMADIPENEELLDILDQLNQEQQSEMELAVWVEPSL